jgi:hypothetical protein
MTGWRLQLRRVALALGVSTAMVVLIATLLPRAFLVNDDPGFALYLRLGVYTPEMSSLFNWALVWLYHVAPGLPWYGLYLYAVIIATGAVLVHTCLDLVDRRPGVGHVATWIGAIVLVASHIILALGVTWTTVSISALGTALVALVAHFESCQISGQRPSWLRCMIYGLLFVAGFVLREAGIAAMGAALLPLLVWIGIGLIRRRQFPRVAAVIGFVAPFAVVVLVQNRIPHARGEEYNEFNKVRGVINGAAAFGDLENRAPELLERAGWTVQEYRDFENWLLADDSEFPIDKVRRLAETGGVPIDVGFAESVAVVRDVVTESAASVWLLFTITAGGLLLGWLGVIGRRRAILFSLSNLVFLSFVPIALARFSRFPQRLSLSFYTVAAFGAFVFFVGEVARRPVATVTKRRGTIALAVIALFALAWARNLLAWTKRDAWPYHATLAAFADRINARNGFIMNSVGIGEMDPLLADSLGYAGLPSGWGTFTAPWYDYIHRFGLHSGAEMLHNMIDNPNAYVVALPYGHEGFEDWVRRRVHIPTVRLALVDNAAGMPASIRLELYRLVSTPLVRDSDEWKLMQGNQRLANDELPGPPDVSDLAFHTTAFAPPYSQHASPFRDPAPGLVVEPVPEGIRCAVNDAANEQCAADGQRGRYAGVHIPTVGLAALRFDITLVDSQNILGVYVNASTDTTRSIRWRWELDAAVQQFGYSGPFVLVPGYPAHDFKLVGNSANPDDIRGIDVFVAVKPGTHAGFELRHVEVAAP